ncbi:SCO7613 C-terminal domain-containing membrane protein [Nocardioides hungaricus]
MTETTSIRYADPDRCPDCSAALHRPLTECGECGLPLTGDDAARLYRTLQIADQYLARLRYQAAYGGNAEPAVAAPTSGEPVAWKRSFDLPAPRSGVSWTVPAVLLTLGAACLTVGALVFLAVTWSVLGVGGRTAVLLGLTGVALAVTALASRRGLRGAAEAFATLAGMFAAFDMAGAYQAGWLGDLDGSGAVTLGGVTLAVLAGGGNAALRGSRTGLLMSPQLLAAAGLGAAALVAPFTWDAHVTTVVGVTLALLLAAAAAARRTGQIALAGGAAGLATATWLALVGLGLVWVSMGEVRVGDTAPWLIAAGYAAAAFAVALRRSAARWWSAHFGVAAYLLVVATVTVHTADTSTGVVVAAAVAAVLAAALSPLARAAAPAAMVAAGTLATAAAALALTWPTALIEGVLDAVATESDLTATFTPVTTDLTTAPWTVPLAAAVVGAVLLALRPAPAGTWVPVGAAAAGVTLLGYVDGLLAVVAVAAAVAALHLAARWASSGPRWLAWTGAIGWASAAAGVAAFHPAPLSAVGVAASAVALALVVRGSTDEAPVAATALAPLAGLTTAAVGWLVDAPAPWAAVAAIVVIGLTATVLATSGRGPAWPRDGLALGVAGAAALVGTEAAADQGAWAAGYLALLGVVTAALALAGRSLIRTVLATGFQLAALWVRLAVADVATPEAYTLPLAAVLLGYGAWWMRRDRSLGTTRTLLPGLAVGLVPSLALAADDPVSPRAAIFAVACGLLLAVGAIARLRAPLLAGAGAGLVLVIAELAPYTDAVPRWVSLSAAGAVLLTAGVRWEHLAGAGRRGWGHLLELR